MPYLLARLSYVHNAEGRVSSVVIHALVVSFAPTYPPHAAARERLVAFHALYTLVYP